jgi:formate/nitrite transporter FocA (FNT family)
MVGGALAGAYVGVTIILIITMGAVLPVDVCALAMGTSFGLALILVVYLDLGLAVVRRSSREGWPLNGLQD